MKNIVASLLVFLSSGMTEWSVAHADFDVARVEPSVARIVADLGDEYSTGTGFVLNACGDVATNHHVIDGARGVEVLRSGAVDALPADVVWRSAALDLAVLRVSGDFAPPAKIAAARIDKGAAVYAMGFPGLADRLGVATDATVTDGIISRFSAEPWEAGGAALSVIQHTAAVNPGNSGGPLFDACGRVVGVNTKAVAASAGHGLFLASDIGELTRALDANGIAYLADNAVCESAAANIDSQARDTAQQAQGAATDAQSQAQQAAQIAAENRARMMGWGAAIVALLLLILMLALRKPRERIVRVVEGYSRRIMHRSGAPAVGHKRSSGGAGKTHAPGLLLAGFSGDGHPLRIRVDADALNSAPTGISIGREPALVDMPLQDAQISRRHLRFSARDDHAVVEDLNSANGTRLNGKQIKPYQPAAVRPGDTLRLGGIEFAVSALQ